VGSILVSYASSRVGYRCSDLSQASTTQVSIKVLRIMSGKADAANWVVAYESPLGYYPLFFYAA
jgi:hypothetical protein